jgi:hypothetical protein
VRHGIAVYSPHTALDAAEGGMNDWLCAGLGKGKTRPIRPKPVTTRASYKIVTFVPEADADRVRAAMDRGGAGGIGNYRQCSFNAPGHGTFRPIDGAKPAIGRVGELERVDELRVEMLCPQTRLPSALAALREAHPYEEPAIDVFRLEPGSSGGDDASIRTGAGRVLTLSEPIDLDALADRLRCRLFLDHAKVGAADPSRKVRTVAVCVGAGGSLFDQLSPPGDHGIDAFITGEMPHHQALDLVESGAAVLLAGHTHTERPYLPVYRDRLNRRTVLQMGWDVSRADAAPLHWV